jgi:hypothetical protein
MDENTTKPPAQGISPEGFEALKPMGQNMDGTPLQGRTAFNPNKLAAHPPFQMYIESLEANEAGIPSDRYAFERLRSYANALGSDKFMAAYYAWWEEKGYWKGEDPLGGA